MHYLLIVLLSFYPSIFIYTSVPSAWMKKVDALAPASTTMFFITHLIVFALIFFVTYVVFKKFTSLGYRSSPRGGFFGIILMTIFTLAVALIAFYNILPGNIIYNSPALLDSYLLKNPYTLIALIAPFIYLFFD